MVAQLVWQDVKRNLHPIRALPLLILGMSLAYNRVGGPWEESVAHVQGALTLHYYWLVNTIPLIAAIMGGNAGAERRRGITFSLLAKGVRRTDYVRAKLLGAAGSSAAITLALLVGFYVMVSILWPGDRVTKPGNDVSPGPLHQLYLDNPMAHDLVCIPMLLAAAAGLSLIGVLAGLIVANEYVAMAATPITLILSTIFMRSVSRVWSPEEYMNLGYYFYWGPHFRWLIPFAPFLYWGTFAMIIYFICQRIFAKKDIA